jgi:hypothetical protein
VSGDTWPSQWAKTLTRDPRHLSPAWLAECEIADCQRESSPAGREAIANESNEIFLSAASANHTTRSRNVPATLAGLAIDHEMFSGHELRQMKVASRKWLCIPVFDGAQHIICCRNETSTFSRWRQSVFLRLMAPRIDQGWG